MNLSEELVLAFLEEDNVQRAFFRVMPQLTSSGDIREEARNTWLDHGALRVVPDRNEQHTFKDRMRSLGNWCVIDLTIFPVDASKIRTNKNYHPDHGESNQYIIYSDAVTAVPSRVFYEVLDGAPSTAGEAAKAAITPSFYLRDKDALYGPISRENPQEPKPAGEISAVQFDFDSPDGKLHTVLCVASENMLHERPVSTRGRARQGENRQAPPAESKPAQPEQAQSPQEAPARAPAKAPAEGGDTLPIGKPLRILDESLTFEETLKDLDKPLNEDANLLRQRSSIPAQPSRAPSGKPGGTPLYHTPLSTSSPQPRDRLAEVVSGQSRAAKSEPYAEPLPGSAKLKPVYNPVETACDSFKRAWESLHSRPQLVNCVMSLDGMKALLERRQQANTNSLTSLQAAMQEHLSVLEAERLGILVQLDQAKTELDAFRQKAIEEASARQRKELEALEEQVSALRKTAEELRAEVVTLGGERAAIERDLAELAEKAVPASAYRVLREHGFSSVEMERVLRPVPGADATPEELLDRLKAACEACGLVYDRNSAVCCLALVAVCRRLTITTGEPAPAMTLLQNMAEALGWGGSFAVQEETNQQIAAARADADSTPSIVVSLTGQITPIADACRVMLACSMEGLAASLPYKVNRWPVCQLAKLSHIPRLQGGALPVSLKSIRELEGAIPAEEIDKVLKDIYILLPQLSGASRDEMTRVISICAKLMDGGLSSAVDWAIRLWLLPAFADQPELKEALLPLLSEYPLTLKALS